MTRLSTLEEEEEGRALLDVAFTPAEVRPSEFALVVDVLRATSTIVAALTAGFARVVCASEIDQARRMRGPGRALAGERDCRPIEGFDYGNSPRALRSAPVPELVLCTTNGTPAVIAAAEKADEVLMASLLNLHAVARAVPSTASVTIVCAGTDGRFALEDAYVAGRLVDLLPGRRTDAAVAAGRLAGSYGSPYGALSQSADAEVLRATGQTGDIGFCARQSVVDLVPRVTGLEEDLAVVEAIGAASGPAASIKQIPIGKARTFA